MIACIAHDFGDEHNGGGIGRQHIDIDAWLATLPPARRDVALDIISSYADVLRKKASEQYYFSPPSD